MKLIGNGEHADVVREAARGSDASGTHVAFVGRPGGGERRRVIESADPRTRWANVIHPRSTVLAPLCSSGVFIGAGAIVQIGARIHDHAVINTGAIVEHDCVVLVGAHIAPGAVLGGGVIVGNWAWIGLGARVRDHVKIGDGAVVGMGAVVVDDVPPGATVVGCPARPMKKAVDSAVEADTNPPIR